jgi:hypothetical protein
MRTLEVLSLTLTVMIGGCKVTPAYRANTCYTGSIKDGSTPKYIAWIRRVGSEGVSYFFYSKDSGNGYKSSFGVMDQASIKEFNEQYPRKLAFCPETTYTESWMIGLQFFTYEQQKKLEQE